MKTPHLLAALAALVLVLSAAVGGTRYAESIETSYVHALAPAWFPQKTLGSALQRAAFRQPDLLPVYGASELGYPDPYHASTIFQKYPTGFTIFVAGSTGAEPIIILQRLAALGPDLHGKKVVLTLSPSFAMSHISSPTYYAGNFSPLHACEFAFSPDLSLGLKQAGARRMLDYPATLTHHPLLHFGLLQLADASPLHLALYDAAWPLGRVQCAILGLQDHRETLSYIRSQTDLKLKVPHKSKTLDWDTLLDSAQNDYARRSDQNPFGFENEIWAGTYHKQPPTDLAGWSDQTFLSFMNKSEGWTDLGLLLRALKELGAETLILSAPLEGPYFDYVGISPGARQVFYDKLHATVKPYAVWLIDFHERENDMDFFIDAMFHLSSVSWIYYAETMDAFYHGTLGVGR